jgi:hypothetical protein
MREILIIFSLFWKEKASEHETLVDVEKRYVFPIECSRMNTGRAPPARRSLMTLSSSVAFENSGTKFLEWLK